ENLQEDVTITKGMSKSRANIQEEINEVNEALHNLQATYRSNNEVRKEITNLTEEDAKRNTRFAERIKLQEERLQLPLLPTTTIGSLPQTQEVRSTRTKWRKGEITDLDYEQFVNDNINRWIAIQEE